MVSSSSRSMAFLRACSALTCELRFTKERLHPTSWSPRRRWTASCAEISLSAAICANKHWTADSAGRPAGRHEQKSFNTEWYELDRASGLLVYLAMYVMAASWSRTGCMSTFALQPSRMSFACWFNQGSFWTVAKHFQGQQADKSMKAWAWGVTG